METIVDGYNLIFHCGFNSAERSSAAVQNSRRRLFEMLIHRLGPEARSKLTIVFDAQRLPRNETSLDSRQHNIRTIFAVGYEDADTLIEELVRQHSHPKRLRVVSNDHRIQNAAIRRNAQAVGCEEWLDWLESHADVGLSKTGEDQAKPQPEATSSDDWIRVFSSPANPSLRKKVKPADQSKDSRSTQNRVVEDQAFQDEMQILDAEVKRLLEDEGQQ